MSTEDVDEQISEVELMRLRIAARWLMSRPKPEEASA